MGILSNKHERDPFDDFLDGLKEPRQVMNESDMDNPPVDDIDLPEENYNNSDDEQLESVSEQKQRYSLSLIPAETLVNCVDIAMTQVNSMIAKEKVEGASDEEKESLIQAAASYLKEKEIDISPGAMLIVMVLVIYAPKTWQAIELRKANQKNEQLQRQVEALQLQNAALIAKNSEDGK